MKNLILRNLIKTQLKGLPEDQKDKVLEIVEKNPDLFMKIAQETKEKIDSGMDQQTAMMEVAKNYEGELKELM